MSALAPAMRLRVSEIAVWVRSMIRSISSLVLCMLAVVVRTRVRGLWNGINMLPSGIMRRERIVGSLSRHGHLKQMPMRQINTHVAAALRDSRPLVPFLPDGSIAPWNSETSKSNCGPRSASRADGKHRHAQDTAMW